MRTSVQSLAEEYFALTGRPIATMTVEEFIALKNAATTSLHVIESTSSLDTQAKSEERDFMPENGSPSSLSPIETSAINNNKFSQPEPAPDNNSNEANVYSMPTESTSKTTPDNALSMLKSVKG